MKTTLGIVLLLLGYCSAIAGEQNRAAHWFIQGNAHLVFDSQACLPHIDSTVKFSSVHACLADTNGKMIVRLEGDKFIRQDGAVILDTLPRYLNAPLAFYNWNSMIIPKPGSDNFIAFNIRREANKPFRLFYREISFAEGRTVAFGEILPDSNVSDYAIVENADRTGYWLVVTVSDSVTVFSIPITANGVEEQQVVANRLAATRGDFGGDIINFSPDGKTMARVSLQYNILLYDFDLTTGQCTNERTIRLPGVSRDDAEFSPDGSKLYVNLSSYGVWIVQIDLSRKTIADIEASVTDVVRYDETAYWTEGDIQLAPNGHLYFAAPVMIRTVNGVRDTNYYLGEIACPNAAGTLCNADPFAIKVRVQYDLPRFVFTWFDQLRTFGSDEEQRHTLCEGTVFAPHPTLINCSTGYWILPNGQIQTTAGLVLQNIKSSDAGDYRYVQYRCTDTVVSVQRLEVLQKLTPDVTLSAKSFCKGDSVLASIPNSFDDVTWDNGTKGTAAYYSESGTHTVSFVYKGCAGSTTFAIGEYEPADMFAGTDTIIMTKVCRAPAVTSTKNFVNTTGAVLIIDSVSIDGNSVFRALAPNNFPLSIRPKDTLRLVIGIDDNGGASTSANLRIYVHNCSYVHSIALRADIVNAELSLNIPDTTAAIGDNEFFMPLRFTTNCNAGDGQEMVYEIRYNSYVFTVTDAINATILGTTYSGTTAQLQLAVSPQFIPADSMYSATVFLRGMVLLDKSTFTPVEASVVSLPNYVRKFLLKNGSITADSICAQAIRAVSAVKPLVYSVAYDAALQSLRFTGEGGFDCGYSITIHGIDGTMVQQISLPYFSSESAVTLPLAIPSGVYMVCVRNGLYQHTTLLPVVR